MHIAHAQNIHANLNLYTASCLQKAACKKYVYIFVCMHISFEGKCAAANIAGGHAH